MLRIIPKNEGQLAFLKSMEEMPQVIYDPHKREKKAHLTGVKHPKLSILLSD